MGMRPDQVPQPGEGSGSAVVMIIPMVMVMIIPMVMVMVMPVVMAGHVFVPVMRH